MLPKHEQCTGCGSCAAVCPKNCITMAPDEEGFRYPVIDQTQCVNCNQCGKHCPVLHPPKAAEQTGVFAVQNTDGAVRENSSSGGVFTALAQAMIEAGGVVCAAVYREDFAVEHRIAFTAEELAPMRGAKYAQSHAGQLFRQLKELLLSGTPVMFVGTPCQCAAFRTYLGRDYEHLLLVDMICHGVPAPAVWGGYVNRRSELDGQPVVRINLRDKSSGWSGYGYSVLFEYADGSAYCAQQGQDPYMRGFVSDLYSRPSCSQCSFKGLGRSSDLTLGDCWGIWDTHPDFDDNNGTSLLLIQTQNGQDMWDKVSRKFRCIDWPAEAVTKWNPSAVTSASVHGARTVFFERFFRGEPVDELILDILSPKPGKRSLIRRCLRRLLFRR